MQQAIEGSNLPKVRLLLKAGVPADHVYHPSLGWSFAKLAARTGDFEIFCCLVEAGADIARRGGGWPLIQEAVCSRTASPAVVAKVIAEGACSQSDLDNALVCASEFGNPEIVGRLLDAGADPRFVSDDGATALVHAVIHRRTAIAVRLAGVGADPTLRVPYEENYKKTIAELAAVNEMHDFLRVCGGHAGEVSVCEPLPTLADCVRAMERWFRANAPDVTLGPPRGTVPLPAPFIASAGFGDLAAWFLLHDGSGGACVVPMPDDISYYLVPLDEALRERDMMLRLVAEEGPLPDVPPGFWRDEWLPIASNGAGDYLVWDATTAGVLRFSHETRLATARAASLLELFRDIASGLLTGKYTYSDSRGVA